MAPLPIIPDTYRCSLNWTDGIGHHAVNVVHILKALSSPSAVAAALDANANGNMWGYVSPAYVMQRIDVTELDGASASYSLLTSGFKWTGQGAGDAIPAAACVLTLRTAFRGRTHRGRLFLGPISEGGQTAGILTGGVFLTNVQNAWDSWLAAMVAAGFQPVVASYKFPAGQVPITSILVNQVVATQRRRQSRLR